MPNNEAIVNPQKTKSSPDIGPLAVMAATGADLYYLCKLSGYAKNDYQRLFMSRLYYDRCNQASHSIIGPFVGAPYAVMLLENLIAWGARRIIFVGWCGAISDRVKIGNLILPTTGLIDEGTSKHYNAMEADIVRATFPLVTRLRQALNDSGQEFHEGTVWTTDAIYRETRREVAMHRNNGILAVDMEFSALITAATFRKVDLAGILVVSDELSSPDWRPGFKHQRFKQSREAACHLITQVLCDAE